MELLLGYHKNAEYQFLTSKPTPKFFFGEY